MFTLKPISRDSVDGSLAKAERYRLLNEPSEAESICRDILEVDPANRQARVSLILALTDEIHSGQKCVFQRRGATAGLETAYDRAYYSGIAWERRAKAFHRRRRPGIRRPCLRLACQSARSIRGGRALAAPRQR